MVNLPTTTIEYGSLLLGAVDVNGVKWRITGFDGWGSPASSLEVVRKTRQPGAWGGDAFTTERYMAVRLQITAPTPESLNVALDQLNDSVALDDQLFVVNEAGISRWLMVRRSDEVIPGKVTNRIANPAFQVVALDSRKLGDELSASTGLPSSSGGLLLPTAVPFSVDAVTNSGQVSLVNPGNEAGPVVLRIDGPCTGPVVTHVGSGLALVFASSLVLGAGEWLTVDMEARSVMANDQASRSGYVIKRGWSQFTAGQNTWAFTAAAYSADARLTVNATPAWK